MRESDIYTDDEFMAYPMARDVFLPANARRIMEVVIQHGEYSLNLGAHRVIGRAAYSDIVRERLQTYRAMCCASIGRRNNAPWKSSLQRTACIMRFPR